LGPNAIKIMSALKILVIPGSLRSGSLNAKLAATAAHEIGQAGVEVTRISLADFPLPIFDGDLQSKSGVPKQAVNLKRMISAHRGVLIVTPEYNSSVPPLLKNAIDWVSRVQDAHETAARCFANAPLRSPPLPKAGSAARARWRRCGSFSPPAMLPSFRTSSRCRSPARPMTIWTD
jgi:NAD(P)H-dependent FMN reductase